MPPQNYREGTILQNDEGARIQLRNGQWQPIAASEAAQAKVLGPRAVEQSRRSLSEKVKPNLMMERMTGAPLMSMQPGLPSAAQVPENARAMATGAAIGAPVGGVVAGGIRALPTIAGATLGAGAGAVGGSYAGHRLGGIPGRLTGSPELEKQGAGIGEAIGAIGGGLLGGYGGGAAAMRGGRIPLRMRVGGVPVEGELPIGGAGKATRGFPQAEPSVSEPALIRQMRDAIARGTPEEKAMALQRLREMGVEPQSPIVTLEQAAKEGGMASAAGGAPAWETQAYTPEAQRLIQKLRGPK